MALGALEGGLRLLRVSLDRVGDASSFKATVDNLCRSNMRAWCV
jgi:hypothetical protein